MTSNAIGGYFGLELPDESNPLYPDAIKYQSARAAFLSLLRNSHGVRRVWMPYYICESMLTAVRASGKEICFYTLDRHLEVNSLVSLEPNDLLLYVNYFGVCSSQADVLLQRFNPAQIVMDFSQAFYARPRNCLATIYSPRKFFGIPDGGLMMTSLTIASPKAQDSSSEARMQHLIRRLSATPEAGYEDFLLAEDSLKDIEPRRMSRLTERLLASVAHDAARVKRNRNFQFLRKHLDKANRFILPSEVDGPLCYPFLMHKPTQRIKFLKNRIFMATYWPEVIDRIEKNFFEVELVNQCLPIPCDQRCSDIELKKILDLL